MCTTLPRRLRRRRRFRPATSEDRFLPDKAIDLIDESGARARIARNRAPEPVREAEARLGELKAAADEAAENDDMNRAAELKEQEKQVEIELSEARAAWNAQMMPLLS